MIHKTLHRQQKIEQHEPRLCTPEAAYYDMQLDNITHSNEPLKICQ
jgi:hypothetical protein